MKILYTADDQNDAQLAINAIRSVAPDAKIFWAGRLSDAGRWLSANRDVAAIVVDVEVQQQNCAPLVRHVRTLGLDAAVLIVVPEATVLPVAVLESGACQFVLKNRSRFASLAAIVGQALQRDQIGQRLQALAAEEARLREYEARLQTTLAASVRSHEAIQALEAQVKLGAADSTKVD